MTSAVAEGRIHQFTTQSGADTVEVGRKLTHCSAAATADSARRPRHRQDHAGQGHCPGARRRRAGRSHQPHLHPDSRVRRHPRGKPVKLFHLDVYRLEGERQLETLGLDELLTPDALVLVEWGEKFKSIQQEIDWRNRHRLGRRRRPEDHGNAEGIEEPCSMFPAFSTPSRCSRNPHRAFRRSRRWTNRWPETAPHHRLRADPHCGAAERGRRGPSSSRPVRPRRARPAS